MQLHSADVVLGYQDPSLTSHPLRGATGAKRIPLGKGCSSLMNESLPKTDSPTLLYNVPHAFLRRKRMFSHSPCYKCQQTPWAKWLLRYSALAAGIVQPDAVIYP